MNSDIASQAHFLGVVLVMPGHLFLFEGKFDRTLDAINQIFEIEDNDSLRDAAAVVSVRRFKSVRVVTNCGNENDLRLI